MNRNNSIPPPPPATRAWVRALLGLGISVPVTLAPLLGKLPIPLFPALLAMIPSSIQNTVIPASAAAMGLVAVTVEFRALKSQSRKKLAASTSRGVLIAAGFLVLFCIAYMFLVTEVNILGGRESLYFVTGWKSPGTPPCSGISNAACIGMLTTNQTRIASYFGDRQIQLASLILEILYIGFFASFGNVVGILVALRARVNR